MNSSKALKPALTRGQRELISALTKGQRKLMEKHGTPAAFAVAVYQCVPGDISMEEARVAVNKYWKEWGEA